ncbi:FAD-dependent oxidoreductase [Streptomyces sp. NPDC001601]|uniref:FAD-dependent oxidoreductase n=1 Tax=Streptomyces sp. NPDC001601 TaxID=3364592 RepID=UPI0036881878
MPDDLGHGDRRQHSRMAPMSRAVHAAVIGAGLGGMLTAFCLARRGVRVSVFERDDSTVPDTPAAAGNWSRTGVPHLHQTHGFLGAFHSTLRDELPDLLEQLLANGVEVRDFGKMAADHGFSSEAGADVAVLLARRSTVEQVLRRAMTREKGITLRVGTGVDEILVGRGRVRGVRASGHDLDADIVIDASGRRAAPWASWYDAVGDNRGELAYITRMYQLADGAEPGPLSRVSGAGVIGDGYHTVINVHDNRTFSAVLACSPRDRELLRARDARVFELLMEWIPKTGPWVEKGRAVPLSPPRVMSNMRNTTRRISGKAPQGFFALGDALVTTDPSRGFGASMAAVGAAWLAEAIAGDQRDIDAARETYLARLTPWALDWYEDTVAHTATRAKRWSALLDGERVPVTIPIPEPVPAFVTFQLPSADEEEWWHKRRYSQLLETPASLTRRWGGNRTEARPEGLQVYMTDVPTRAEVVDRIEELTAAHGKPSGPPPYAVKGRQGDPR